MRRFILALPFLAVFGCASAPAPTTGTTTAPLPPSGGLAALNAFTSADLANAIAVATKSGTAPGQPGATIVPCFTFIQSQLATLQANGVIPSGTVGVATAFVSADIALNNVTTATSPAVQAAYDLACGPLAMELTNKGLSLSAQVTALIALFPKVP